MTRRRGLLLAALVLTAGTPGAAQEILLRGGRSFPSPGFTAFWLGYAPWVPGPVRLTGSFLLYDASESNLLGLGGEVALPVGAWTVGADAAAGFATGALGGDWGMWSLGVARRLIAWPVGLHAELRYRSIPDYRTRGLELGLRLAIPIGGGGGGGGRGTGPPPPLGPPTGEVVPLTVPAVPRSAAADAVVMSALDVMGTPYVWGGTDANGFDCSGLVQYAYRQHGVALPRRSVDQARAGRAVAARLDALAPGDVLVFASGGTVSHVGLYIGSGRFIHSASRGVKVSRLDQADPEGRWWWERWVGVRRVLDDPVP